MDFRNIFEKRLKREILFSRKNAAAIGARNQIARIKKIAMVIRNNLVYKLAIWYGIRTSSKLKLRRIKIFFVEDHLLWCVLNSNNDVISVRIKELPLCYIQVKCDIQFVTNEAVQDWRYLRNWENIFLPLFDKLDTYAPKIVQMTAHCKYCKNVNSSI